MGLKVEGACGFAERPVTLLLSELKGFAIDPRRKAGTTILSGAAEIEGDPNLTWLTHDRFDFFEPHS